MVSLPKAIFYWVMEMTEPIMLPIFAVAARKFRIKLKHTVNN